MRNRIYRWLFAMLCVPMLCTLHTANAVNIDGAYGTDTERVAQQFASAYGWDAAKMLSLKWDGVDGDEYSRMMSHQITAVQDTIVNTTDLLGIHRPGAGGSGATMAAVARAEVGKADSYESPPGSENVKYNTWYYGHPVSGPAYQWCVVFIVWCADQCGLIDAGYFEMDCNVGVIFENLEKKGGKAYYFSEATVHGGSIIAEPGDLVFWPTLSHIGIITRVTDTGFDVVNGNASSCDGVGLIENWQATTAYVEKTGTSMPLMFMKVNYPDSFFSAYHYLKKNLDLNDAGVCALLANFAWESGGGEKLDPTAPNGIAGWLGTRWDEGDASLATFCERNGYEIASLDAQLAFVVWELREGYLDVLNYLKNQPNTVEGCVNGTDYIGLHYEIYTTSEYALEQRRRDKAQELFERFFTAEETETHEEGE